MPCKMNWRSAFYPCISVILLSGQVLGEPGLNPNQRKDLPPPEYLADDDKVPFQLPTVPPAPPARKQAADAEPDATVSKVFLREIKFSGNQVITTQQLIEESSHYLQRKVSVAELELLRQKLTRYYIDRGYLNSGVLFESPGYQQGVLYLRVIEGRLSEIKIKGAGNLDPDYLASHLKHADDTVLNVNRLRERFQLKLDDPLFKYLNARIVPGQKPGEASLMIDVERARPYQVTLSADNYRAPSLGSQQAGISGWLRNLTGRGDVLEFNADSVINESSGTNYGVSWTMPINYTGTSLRFSVDHGDSALVEEPLDALDINNKLESHQVTLSHVFIDELKHHFSMGLDFIDRENATTVSGLPFSFIANEISGTTSTEAFRFWQSYRYRTQTQAIALRSTFTQVDTNLIDIDPANLTAGVRLPEKSYAYWVGQMQYARKLEERDWQLVLRATTQLTDNKMLSMDGLSVGGRYSIRGFRENQLLRDNGYFINAEIEIPVFKDMDRGALTLIPFIDYGEAWNTDESSEQLSSIGVAMRYRLNRFNVDIAWAGRMNSPQIVDSQSGTLQDNGFHVQLRYDLFDQ